MTTRVQKKQIANNKVAKMVITGFVANGASDIVTPELVTAAAADGVTVIPSAGTEASLGFIVTPPNNKVNIIDNTSKNLIGDINSNEIFGRLTEAAGVYTLSYFSVQNGIETSVSLNLTIDFLPSYNFAFKDFPFDANLRFTNSALVVIGQAPSLLEITANSIIQQHFDFIEADLTTAPADSTTIITLGDLANGSIIKNKLVTINRIDTDTTKKLRVSGLNNNFVEDNSFTLLTETVSSPASGNTLTASADVSDKLRNAGGDTIRVNNADVFTIASVVGNIITTVEAIIASYSADTLEVGGVFIDLEDSIQIRGRNNNEWRGI